MTTLETYIRQFAILRRAPNAIFTEATKKRAPHKPILLLAEPARLPRACEVVETLDRHVPRLNRWVYQRGAEPALRGLTDADLGGGTASQGAAGTRETRAASQPPPLRLAGDGPAVLTAVLNGSITVIDLRQEKVVGSVDTLKNQGFNPNSIVLLPEWNHLAGH